MRIIKKDQHVFEVKHQFDYGYAVVMLVMLAFLVWVLTLENIWVKVIVPGLLLAGLFLIVRKFVIVQFVLDMDKQIIIKHKKAYDFPGISEIRLVEEYGGEESSAGLAMILHADEREVNLVSFGDPSKGGRDLFAFLKEEMKGSDIQFREYNNLATRK